MIWCVTLNPALDVTYRLTGTLSLGSVNQAQAMDAQLGGKGNNVARVVHQLGYAVTMVEILGGSVGVELGRRAELLGIPLLAESVDDDSRICLSLVSDTGTVTELRPLGPEVDGEVAERLLSRLVDQALPGDWVTISGSLPRGLGPGTYAHWVRTLKSRGCRVIVDCSGAALLQAAKAGPDAVVPNEAEYQAAVEHLPRQGTTEVIVTRGSEGVEWHISQGGLRCWAAPVVNAVNPVGAGDTFLGSLVASLSVGAPWAEAIPNAVAAASASVESLGVAVIDAGRVRELSRQVQEVKDS